MLAGHSADLTVAQSGSVRSRRSCMFLTSSEDLPIYAEVM